MVIQFLDLPQHTTICKHCGAETPFNDMIWLNGETYCPKCYLVARQAAAEPEPVQDPKPKDKHNIMKNLREQTGLSQIKFAEKFEIPVKSLQNWEAERTAPPPYIIFMVKRILDLENVREGENDG